MLTVTWVQITPTFLDFRYGKPVRGYRSMRLFVSVHSWVTDEAHMHIGPIYIAPPTALSTSSHSGLYD